MRKNGKEYLEGKATIISEFIPIINEKYISISHPNKDYFKSEESLMKHEFEFSQGDTTHKIDVLILESRLSESMIKIINDKGVNVYDEVFPYEKHLILYLRSCMTTCNEPSKIICITRANDGSFIVDSEVQ